MKKIILFLVFAGIGISLFAQQPRLQQGRLSPEKDAYLQKSRRLWKTAITVVSVGGAMAIGGLIAAGSRDIYSNDNTSAVLFIGGCGVMLSSLAFSIPASIAKRKAKMLSFKNEPSLQLQQGLVLTRYVPSINLKIGLGRLRSDHSAPPQF